MRHNEKDIKNNEINAYGDDKMAKKRLSTPKGVVLAVITIYGLVAFLNPEHYPIIGALLKNTQYAHLGQYDSLLGLALLVFGILMLFKET